MNQATFRLESFSDAFQAAAQMVHPDHVDDAYRKGLAEGRALRAADQISSLTAALTELQNSLQAQASLLSKSSLQTVSDLAPVLNEIVECLAENGQSAGLQTALQHELLRLAGDITAPSWHITCPAETEPMIRRCAEAAGIPDADIRVLPEAQQAVIVMEDGHSAFANDGIVQHFRDLIAELQESYR